MSDPLELTYVFPSGFTLVLPIFNGTITSINWGDGNTTYNTGDYTADKTHVYSSGGTYNVSVLGTSITQLSNSYGNGATGAEYLSECNSFGEIGLTELYFSFYSTPLLTTIPSSLPTLSTITSMRGLFQSAGVNTDYSSITSWDVSGVQDMQAAFYGSNMNVDISGWDVSSVTTMRFMFGGNNVFNQPLNGWGTKTGEVLDMDSMFSQATLFNQPLNSWDVSKVTTMVNMFLGATAFNQDISIWDVSSVNNANGMFNSANAFNNGGAPGTSINPLSWGITTGNFTNISSMFSQTNNFNQDISDWDVSKVTNVRQLFAFNNAFNQNLNDWNLTSLSDATLMFYGASSYNNGGVTLDWTGKIPLLNNMNGMFSAASSFNQIVLLDTGSVTDMGGVFSSAQVFNQDISNWDFSSVTNVNSMFNNSLFNYDVSSWKITSLTNMRAMFLRATAFNNGDVPITGTFLSQISNVTNMKEMFYEAPAFNQDISDWDVSSVTDMSSMFFGASAFNNNSLSLNWGSKTSNVTRMESMFNASYLSSVFNQDISGWDVSSVENMSGMFRGATAFNNNGVALNWDTYTSKVTNMSRMFSGATAFNQNISNWDVSIVTDMSDMFNGAALFNQPIGNWNVLIVEDMSNMFNAAVKFNQNISNWDVSSVGNMYGMFQNANDFNNGGQPLTWATGTNTSQVTSMSYMFENASSFNQPIGGWNVSSVEEMDRMFSGAVLFNQPIGSWDVSGVYSMYGMFLNATSFNQPLNGWGNNTRNVGNMNSMFNGAVAFNQNISGWNVSNVNYMSNMFNGASSFNQLIGGWNVSNVYDFGSILYSATSFNKDISSWDISNTGSIYDMLSYCFLSTANYNKALNSWAALTYTGESEGFYFGGYGLVYSSAGADAHDTLTQLSPPYNWIFAGDAYVSETTIKVTVPFSLTINSPVANPETETTYFQSGDYQLYYDNNPFSSVVTYDNTVDNVIDFTNLVFSTTGLNLPLVLKYTAPAGRLGDPVDIATYYLNAYPNTIVCFKEDTKILTDKGYIPIQDLRNGDLVKTSLDGYKPIFMIAKREIYHSALEERIKDQLYKCTNEKYPEIFEDLVITGCHSVLVNNFKDDNQREQTSKILGQIYVTDDKYRLPICLDEKAEVYEKEGSYTVYHIALENENYTWNYGIFANGLLVESCSKRYLKERAGMTVV
jgi:surface protein